MDTYNKFRKIKTGNRNKNHLNQTSTLSKTNSLTSFNFKTPTRQLSILRSIDSFKTTTPLKHVKSNSLDVSKNQDYDVNTIRKKIEMQTPTIQPLKIKLIKDDNGPEILSPPGYKQKDLTLKSNPFENRKRILSTNDLLLPSVKARTAEPFKDSNLLSLKSVQYIVDQMKKQERDIEKIYAITKHMKFFAQYKADIVKEMLRAGVYELYNKEDIIFKEGDLGKHLFVIISGSIGVRKESAKPGQLSWIINSRYDGEVIGEYAIVRGNISNEAGKRSATCFAAETCHMIRISAEDYMRSVQANIDIESKILQFLNGLGPFERIPPIDLALLANTLNKKYFGLDEIVLEAGNTPVGMYIIYSGRVRLTYPLKTPKYSKKTNKITFEMSQRDFYLPRGSYFGQRVLLNQHLPAVYSVISDSTQTSMLVITTHEFNLLFNPYKDETLTFLSNSRQFDMIVPNSYFLS